MRRSRTLIFVFLIIIIAAVVAFVAYNQFLKPPAVVAPVYTEIYVAGQNISQGSTVTVDSLTTIKIAPENIIALMYTLEEQSNLVGKLAKFPLEQGVVLTEAMVGDSSTAVTIPGPSWAALIPPGMTAMSVPINRLSLSGYAINNGAHVNLNACFVFVDVDPIFQTMLPNLTAFLTSPFTPEDGPPIISLGVDGQDSPQGKLELDPSLQLPYYLIPSEHQRPRMVCQMLLQDIVVMKLGEFSRDLGATIGTPSVTTVNEAGETVQTNPIPDMVTLIVTPQDAITLTYLLNIEQQTWLSMTLRNPNDQARQATEAATLQFLLGQYNIPVPAKLPYALEPTLSSLLPSVEPVVAP